MNFDIEDEKPNPGLEKFAGEFLSDRQEELNKMKAFLDINDLEAIRKLAHKWKGFCAPYGFQVLELLAQELESNASKGEKNLVDESLNKISDYLVQKEKVI